jgi:hypothetical protein
VIELSSSNRYYETLTSARRIIPLVAIELLHPVVLHLGKSIDARCAETYLTLEVSREQRAIELDVLQIGVTG